MIPKSFTEAIGMSESTYRWFSAIAGAVAGAVCVVGFVGLVYRRATNARVRRTTSRTDLLVYFLLAVLIGLGCWMTFAHNLIDDVAVRLPRLDLGVVALAVRPAARRRGRGQGADTVYQVHAIVAWAFWALFPFSRLVHAWSIPLQYLGRPYILYRRRYRSRAAVTAMNARPARRSRSPRWRSPSCFYAWSLLGPLGPDLQEHSASPTSRRRRWSPCRCCSGRSCGSRSGGSPTASAAGACSRR